MKYNTKISLKHVIITILTSHSVLTDNKKIINQNQNQNLNKYDL